MASPNATFTELVSTTFRKHRKEFADNFTHNNAFLRRLMKKGMKRMEDGGLSIVTPLEYGSNTTYQRYSGYDILNVQASEVFTAAEYVWRSIALNVVANGQELRENAGESRIINLSKSRLKNAMRTFQNNFSADAYSSGSLANQVNGLQALVSDAGTGVVGGIDSSVYPFWANAVQSFAAPLQGGGAITASSTTIESMMLNAFLNQVRGDDKPDLILASNDYFAFFELSQVSNKRYVNEEDADAGFVSMKYKTADVVFDGGSLGGGIPASHMYFLNTDYMELVVHSQADLEILDEMRPYNQDAAIIPIIWMGNLVCSNRRLQLVLHA